MHKKEQRDITKKAYNIKVIYNNKNTLNNDMKIAGVSAVEVGY